MRNIKVKTDIFLKKIIKVNTNLPIIAICISQLFKRSLSLIEPNYSFITIIIYTVVEYYPLLSFYNNVVLYIKPLSL